MKLKDLLATKGNTLVTIKDDVCVFDAATAMVDAGVGSVLVYDQKGELIGILTERDVLRVTAKYRANACAVSVTDIMTRDVLIGLPDDSVDSVMSLMDEKGLRHMPILEDGKVIGVVSMKDIVRAKRSAMKAEIRHLESFIHGNYPG